MGYLGTDFRMSNENKKGIWIGLGIALGAGFGTVVFAITMEAWYIGLGVAVGLVIGAVIDSFKNSQKKS